MSMADSYPFKETVLNDLVEALLDLKHCKAPGGGSGGATTPPDSLFLPPLPAIARRKRSRTKITLRDAKKGKIWSFASMPANEAADHRSTKKNPPMRVSVPAIGRKTAPFNGELSQLDSYELYELAPLKLRIKIIPVSNTKMPTFGKDDDIKGKRKIADAGLEGDYICNTKKAKLSAKFEAGANSFPAQRAPFNPTFVHFAAGETLSSAQRPPFKLTWRNMDTSTMKSLAVSHMLGNS